MKKFFLSIAAALMLGGIANAQSTIVSSTGVNVVSQDTPSETQWIVRAGMNFAGMTGDGAEDTGTKLGYDVAVSFQKPLSDFGMFWGMELGLGTRGYSYEEGDFEQNFMAHNVRFSPFTFGYAYQINETMKVDAHLGAWVSYDLWGKMTEKEDGEEAEADLGEIDDYWGYQNLDAGMTFGIGFWYDRFNLDLSWQRGFIEVIDDWKINSNNLMLRVGVAF